MKLRDANEGDVDFLAWVMLAASRSHLPLGIWEYMNRHSEEQTLAFLSKLAVTDVVHFCHFSLFLIAEVDGTPAAALCGYDSPTEGMTAMMQVMPALGAEAGIVYDEDFMRRAAVIGSVSPENADGALVVENVATSREFRRRGLVNALLEAVIERARSCDYTLAQISVFIGNTPAREAYLKAGFELKDEKRDATFEAELGCPGIERLLLTL